MEHVLYVCMCLLLPPPSLEIHYILANGYLMRKKAAGSSFMSDSGETNRLADVLIGRMRWDK